MSLRCAKMQVGTDFDTPDQTRVCTGDDPEGPFYPGWIPLPPMSTALAYFYCDEGFVIAADGRDVLVSAQGREIASETAQKIVPVRGPDREAAFSFTGRTTLYDPADEHRAFDFPREFHRAAREMQSESASNGAAFLSGACALVQARLDAVIKSVGIGKLPSRRGRGDASKHDFLTIHLDGYFSERPVRVGANFYHVKQKVAWDTMAPHTLDCPKRSWTRLLGSYTIGGMLFDTEDERLARYRTDACRKVAKCYTDSSVSITLDDAIEAGRSFIAACSDDDLRALDAENGHGIGGHIHIAAITPKDGFRWIVPPVAAAEF